MDIIIHFNWNKQTMGRLFIFLISFFSIGYQGTAIAETVVLCTGEWAPYTSQNMDGFGAFTEIVSDVFKEMNIKPVYKFYPWKRAERMTKEGNAFATFPYKVTGERKMSFDFSEPVMFSTGRFFYIRNNFPQGIAYQTFEDLSKYEIGGILGYWYETPFKESKLSVDYTTTDEQSIKMLYSDRVQLVATDELVGWSLIKKLYPQEISRFAVVEKPMNIDKLCLMISRKYPNSADLTNRFNTALAKLQKNGKIQHILVKHGVKN